MTRLYVAGPMTGYEDFNFPEFFKAQHILEGLGYDVENPAANDGPTLEPSLANALRAKDDGATWASYLKRDLVRLVGCDGVVVLPGWQRSQGASLEVDVATRLGMPIYCLQQSCTPADCGMSCPCDGVSHKPRFQLVPRVRAIGLSGYARAGKDTVGRILVEQHGYVRASFADKLREVALAIDPPIEGAGNWQLWRLSNLIDAIGWEGAKDAYPEVRRLLQRIGTEAGRDIIAPNLWVDLAFRDIPDGARVVFTDCRFPNEAEAIKRSGGEVWRIERPGCEPVNAHPSETALDGFDFDVIVDNSRDLEWLDYAVTMALADVDDAARA